ncbi:LysR substrate-binding domain-containing protein [Neisseriaceae bacterium ESL0693]|nr:LysR substrate-binding domain-containing protein [Neisseriaceae bacterium ESL0693]
MINLKALQCWVYLVDNHSFSETAEKMSLSQPSISKMIRTLENELGVALLHKGESGRKHLLRPTEMGELLYHHAKTMLQQEALLQQDMADYRHLKTGTLRIGMSLLGSRLLTPAIFQFHRQWPEIKLAFVEAGSRDIEAALLDQRLDVGQLMAPVNNAFDSIWLCSYPLMVVMPRQRASHLPPVLPLRRLRDDDFILFTRGFMLYDRIISACHSQGFEPNIVCRTSQWDLVRDMVAQNMGIALLPQYYTDEFNPDIFAVIPLIEPAINWQLHMAWLKHTKTTPAVKAWLNIVRHEFNPKA